MAQQRNRRRASRRRVQTLPSSAKTFPLTGLSSDVSNFLFLFSFVVDFYTFISLHPCSCFTFLPLSFLFLFCMYTVLFLMRWFHVGNHILLSSQMNTVSSTVWTHTSYLDSMWGFFFFFFTVLALLSLLPPSGLLDISVK